MQKLSDWVNRLAEVGLAVTLGALSVVVFLQVIFRYVLNLPLFWTEETARYCLVWASFLGAGVALKRGQHIAVTFLVDRLAPKARLTAWRLSQLSVTAIVVVIAWGGLELVQVTAHQLSPALRIPMSYPYLAIPLGGVIMFIHLVAAFFQPMPPSQAEACSL